MAGTCPACNLSEDNLGKIKAAMTEALTSNTPLDLTALAGKLGLPVLQVFFGVQHVLYNHVPQPGPEGASNPQGDDPFGDGPAIRY